MKKKLKLSIIICTFNERKTIEEVINRITKMDLGENWVYEVIVIDNNSTDGTKEILQQFDKSVIHTIFNERNLGKGMSVRIGIQKASGDYFVIQDADMEYDPYDLPQLTRKVEETGVASVFGSRVLNGPKYKYSYAYLGIRVLTLLTNIFFGANLTDVGTATKMVDVKLAKSLNLITTGFPLDFELCNKILLAGEQILEVPISYDPRTYAEGKKMTIREGLVAILITFRDRLGLSPVWKKTGSGTSGGI